MTPPYHRKGEATSRYQAVAGSCRAVTRQLSPHPGGGASMFQLRLVISSTRQPRLSGRSGNYQNSVVPNSTAVSCSCTMQLLTMSSHPASTPSWTKTARNALRPGQAGSASCKQVGKYAHLGPIAASTKPSVAAATNQHSSRKCGRTVWHMGEGQSM